MYDRGNPKPVLCENLEGWGGEGGAGGRRHVYAYDQFMLMYGRGHQNTVK